MSDPAKFNKGVVLILAVVTLFFGAALAKQFEYTEKDGLDRTSNIVGLVVLTVLSGAVTVREWQKPQ